MINYLAERFNYNEIFTSRDSRDIHPNKYVKYQWINNLINEKPAYKQLLCWKKIKKNLINELKWICQKVLYLVMILRTNSIYSIFWLWHNYSLIGWHIMHASIVRKIIFHFLKREVIIDWCFTRIIPIIASKFWLIALYHMSHAYCRHAQIKIAPFIFCSTVTLEQY
jgi:hypothetical protein